MAVLLETTLGDVVIDLYTEERPRGEACVLRARAAGGPRTRCPGSLPFAVFWLELGFIAGLGFKKKFCVCVRGGGGLV